MLALDITVFINVDREHIHVGHPWNISLQKSDIEILYNIKYT